MTQCAVEERRNLELAIRGLVTYAETLSVYGTEPVFVDGDDTPWSKAFLGAAYASRGVKVRFTSGTGSEALMGYAQGLSMLYLEARCLAVVRAAGSQGVQNGSISCVALVLSVPGGTRAILGENVLAAWLDLEVASGNDAIASHSEIRKTAKLMGQFLPGTDFVTSGYSIMPRHDNTFGGGNFDADDLDEWLTIQRDWQVDAGIEPVPEDELLRVRERAARAAQAVFEGLGLPAISDEEVAVATSGYDAREMPDRDRAADVEAADDLLARGVSGLDVALALDRGGFADVAEAVLGMQRQRVSADYLQTSAVIDADGLVRSAVNDPNEYAGPGTGYRLEGERWALLQSLPHVVVPADLLGAERDAEPVVAEGDEAAEGRDASEVVVAVGPRLRDGDPAHDRGSRAQRGSGGGLRRGQRGRRRAAHRSRPPCRRRRLHRPRRRSALWLPDSDRAPVEGDGRHPPRRPPAAGQPRAVRHVAALHARVVSRDGPERGRLCARPSGGPGPDAARQLRAREAHRADDAAARAGDAGDRAGRRSRRAPAPRARRFRRMKVEFLFWEGCPSYPEARELLESLLVEHGIEQPIDVVEVVTQEDAVRLAFPGSPTIRIDGRDVDEAGARRPPA